MARTAFFRHGQQRLIKQRVDSATVISQGDALFLDTNDVKPAADFTWTSNLATTQSNFASVFIGIAVEKSASGQTDDISVDVSPDSVWEFVCASTTWELSDTFSMDEGSSALLSQTLEKVASDSLGIFQPTNYKASAATLIPVTFASAYSISGANRQAAIG